MGKASGGGARKSRERVKQESISVDDVFSMLNADEIGELRERLNNMIVRSDDVNDRLAKESHPTDPKGHIVEAFGPNPTDRFNLQYEVVELDSLIPSNTMTGAVNPDFPQELQPRDRSKDGSRLQIEGIAQRLEPDAYTTEFKSLDRGAPILGKDDNVVESGNGRTLALMTAESTVPESWQKYQDALKDSLQEKGIDPEVLEKFNNPVLVRRRVDDVDRVKFAQAANEATGLQMSTAERAKSDASRISSEQLIALNLSDDTDKSLQQAQNRDFVRSFVGQLPDNERAVNVDKKGNVTQSGLERMKSALFTRVYGDPRLAEQIFESNDSNIKNVTNGLMANLGRIGQAEELVKRGERAADLSIAGDVAAAVGKFSELKRSGDRVDEYLAQQAMFGRELSATQEKILTAIDERSRSGKKVNEFLGGWADLVEREPNPNQSSFMGPSVGRSKDDLVDIWLSEPKQQDQRGFF